MLLAYVKDANFEFTGIFPENDFRYFIEIWERNPVADTYEFIHNFAMSQLSEFFKEFKLRQPLI